MSAKQEPAFFNVSDAGVGSLCRQFGAPQALVSPAEAHAPPSAATWVVTDRYLLSHNQLLFPLDCEAMSTACLYSVTEMLTTQADRFSPEEVRAPSCRTTTLLRFDRIISRSESYFIFCFHWMLNRWNRCLRLSRQM